MTQVHQLTLWQKYFISFRFVSFRFISFHFISTRFILFYFKRINNSKSQLRVISTPSYPPLGYRGRTGWLRNSTSTYYMGSIIRGTKILIFPPPRLFYIFVVLSKQYFRTIHTGFLLYNWRLKKSKTKKSAKFFTLNNAQKWTIYLSVFTVILAFENVVLTWCIKTSLCL